MATETLNLNLNVEANPPEESPAIALDPPATAQQEDQPPVIVKEADGSKGPEGASPPLVPKPLLPAPDSDVQKKIRRAERFGVSVQLSEVEKRNSRAERFGTAAPTSKGSDASKKSDGSNESKKAEELKRKARAERFGLPVPSATTDEEAKKKARMARFAPPPKVVDAVEEDKRKARALRFSEVPSSAPSEANGKGNIEPKTAIAGNATGGA